MGSFEEENQWQTSLYTASLKDFNWFYDGNAQFVHKQL